jgi:hypothetical protein
VPTEQLKQDLVHYVQTQWQKRHDQRSPAHSVLRMVADLILPPPAPALASGTDELADQFRSFVKDDTRVCTQDDGSRLAKLLALAHEHYQHTFIVCFETAAKGNETHGWLSGQQPAHTVYLWFERISRFSLLVREGVDPLRRKRKRKRIYVPLDEEEEEDAPPAASASPAGHPASSIGAPQAQIHGSVSVSSPLSLSLSSPHIRRPSQPRVALRFARRSPPPPVAHALLLLRSLLSVCLLPAVCAQGAADSNAAPAQAPAAAAALASASPVATKRRNATATASDRPLKKPMSAAFASRAHSMRRNLLHTAILREQLKRTRQPDNTTMTEKEQQETLAARANTRPSTRRANRGHQPA